MNIITECTKIHFFIQADIQYNIVFGLQLENGIDRQKSIYNHFFE